MAYLRDSDMKVSFIIPAYNEEAYLPECLSSLQTEVRKNGGGIETEIIVVDNASEDRTADVAGRFPEVTVLSEKKKGVQNARQAGFEKSTGDIVVFFDADTVVPSGWITLMKKEFEGEGIVAVTGPYLYYDLPVIWKDLMRLRQHTVSRLVHLLFGYYVVAGNVAVKREALININGLDTSIPFYGDDADLGRRLSEVGTVKYVTDLQVLSSARRYNRQGILKTSALYSINFLSVATLKRPITKTHSDIR